MENLQAFAALTWSAVACLCVSHADRLTAAFSAGKLACRQCASQDDRNIIVTCFKVRESGKRVSVKHDILSVYGTHRQALLKTEFRNRH